MRELGWVVLIFGVWIVVSPWVTAFLGIDALWNSVFSGAVVAICGIWWLFGEERK